MSKRKRKQQVIRFRSKKRSSISQGTEKEYFDAIPVDLIIKILSRLPLKCMAQCRRVSKLWSSIIHRSNYDQLFPNKSLASPLLLLAFDVAEKLFFKSSPQPQNSDVNTSLVFTSHHTNIVIDPYRLSRPVCGLVCLQHVKKNSSAAVIYNPVTGESLSLPKLRFDGMTSERKTQVRYCFGYDPIDKQLKVLRITWLRCGFHEMSGEYQVLTLGTSHLSWRKIQCCTLHYPLEDNDDICINGVLYYPARLDNNGEHTMVCFDVRSMEFSFINIGQDMAEKISDPFTFSLIDYKGKLGAYNCDLELDRFELLVLNDSIWSKHIYEMPHTPWPWNAKGYVVTGGMIASGEIVLYIYFIGTRCSFTIYFNLETKAFTSVSLQAPVLNYYGRLYTFGNYVPELTLI